MLAVKKICAVLVAALAVFLVATPAQADARHRRILTVALDTMPLDDALAICDWWDAQPSQVNRHWWSYDTFTRKNLPKKDVRRVMARSCAKAAEEAALRLITDPGMNVPEGLTIPGVVLLPCYMRPEDPKCATPSEPRRNL